MQLHHKRKNMRYCPWFIHTILVVFFAFYFYIGVAQSKIELLSTGLLLVDVETEGKVEPTCDQVLHPEGSMGGGIVNAIKVPGRLRLIQNQDTLYDSGDYKDGVSGITIRVRGNTSAWTDKKPYKIKLQHKADLIAFDDDFADKDWVLLKDAASYTRENEMSLRPMIGFKVGELLGMQWTPRCKYINLMINQEYRGIYLLAESVKRNAKARLNVSKDGYIIEHDPYWWNEDLYFETAGTASQLYKFTFKYPKADEIKESQVEYIRNYMNEVEESIKNGSYADKIDVMSFAKWILAHDILGNNECGGTNRFLTKYDDTDESLIMMGNLWDFDACMREPVEGWHEIHNIMYYKQLFESKNGTFVDCYCDLWDKISSTLKDDIMGFLDAYIISAEGESLNKARIYEASKWGEQFVSVSSNVEFARQWFIQRMQWLSESIKELKGSSTKIRGTVLAPQKESTYRVDGIKTNSIVTKGIEIKGGRKFFCN